MYHAPVANIAERLACESQYGIFSAWHCANTDNCCFYLSSWLVFICFCDMLLSLLLLSIGWSFVCASPMCIKIYCKRTQGSWLTICLTRPKLIDKPEQKETQRIFDDQKRFGGTSLSTSLNVYMWKCQRKPKPQKEFKLTDHTLLSTYRAKKKRKSAMAKMLELLIFYSLSLSTPWRLLSYANLL